jgi:hypothetical protein
MLHILPYFKYFFTFVIAQVFAVWGQFYTLKYPTMGMLEAFVRAIPFAWFSWFLMTYTIGIGDKHKIVTPTQDMMLLIILQFSTVFLINTFWLKQVITRSDFATFIIILGGFYVSLNKSISNTYFQ